MLARAIALASVLGEDAAPLDVLPEPHASASLGARDRLLARGSGSGARAAAIARETVALFTHPAPAIARRVLPRGLAIALAPPAPEAPAGALPVWLARGLGACGPLGLRALARAAAGDDPGATAELLRRLSADEATMLLAARRARVGPEEEARSRLVVAVARRDDRVPSPARRVGLFRLAWAASIEPGAVAALAAALGEPERAVVGDAAGALWFAASEDAAAERALIAVDLEELA